MPRAAVSEPPPPDGPVEGAGLTDAVVGLGRAAGLAVVGVTTAETFAETRRHLFERRDRGLDGGMQFTYRNPDRSTDPSRILPGARSLVVGAWSYRRAEPDPTADPSSPDRDSRPRGTVARYARADHYASLRTALAPVAQHLRGEGWRATVVCDDNALVDRAAAHRAGIGWFGKNSLLLLPGAGSWFVLGSVVTDAPMRPTTGGRAPAAHAEGCGSCARCLGACPTGALVAPGVLDARRCLAWLVQAPGPFPLEYRAALGDRIYGCDDCQQVCPINKVADRRSPPPPDDGSRLDLLDLLEATDEELLAAHGRWYIPDRQPRYLRRNALVALGNVGNGRHPGTARAVSRWLRADDPMLREHARWAAHRLGRDDLTASL
ncbi:MAG TPA: tRNA epoxyqueuosine(34) reductase QueG [Acidimicrobiales bacterium]